jgi:hypothetical protein
LTPFGHKIIIVGDQNMVKTGFKYEVWGTSSDPSTWFEKNTQYTRARQLKREIKAMSFERKQLSLVRKMFCLPPDPSDPAPDNSQPLQYDQADQSDLSTVDTSSDEDNPDGIQAFQVEGPKE